MHASFLMNFLELSIFMIVCPRYLNFVALLGKDRIVSCGKLGPVGRNALMAAG